MATSEVPGGKVVSSTGMCCLVTFQRRYSALNQQQPRGAQQQQSPKQPQQSSLQAQQQSSPRIGPLNQLVDPLPSVGEEGVTSLGGMGIVSVFCFSSPPIFTLSPFKGGPRGMTLTSSAMVPRTRGTAPR